MTAPRIPKTHARHTNGVPCGCWLGVGNSITCRLCGASYLLAEVQEFPPGAFTCYDCGASVHLGGMTPLTHDPKERP